MLSVQEDKLAGENDESLVGRTVEIFIAVIQELNELAGVARCGLVGELALGIEGESGLGGIGDDESHFGLFSEFEILFELSVRVEAAADDVNHIDAVNDVAVVKPLKIDVIQSILGIQHI